MPTYRLYTTLDLPEIQQEVLADWQVHATFQQSIDQRQGAPLFRLYEGPPSANGAPGVHHLLARTIKDLFARYKTMQGYQVPRRSGWDTHGLPVEIAVEKSLGITKQDIGHKISVADYNQACRSTVMRYQADWERMTTQMGYWTDLDNPYITYEADYISRLWGVLHRLYEQGLLYKGYTIQPYSPAAGTGLSTHELNQPGCYREVKTTTITAQFQVADQEATYLLAWTTTPWTLPANTALAVHPELTYVAVRTQQPYTGAPVTVILAQDRLHDYFPPALENASLQAPSPQKGQPRPWSIVARYPGHALAGWRYRPLLPYIAPTGGQAFEVVPADFVVADEGTGIIHIAPTFGADDYALARAHGLASVQVPDGQGGWSPIVDRQGRFVPEITDFAGAYVKSAYAPEALAQDPSYVPLDRRLAQHLKEAGKAFRVATIRHSYPHCWRTDKPILYYPLSSWFVRTTALREQLIAANKAITWYPPSTGEGRFGHWLENLVDWNLSRSRYWGTPLPIWRTRDGREECCIKSLDHLRQEVDKAVKAGLMEAALPPAFDPHRPYVDQIILLSPKGQPMYREADLVDVWFDSGAMPYAQSPYDPSSGRPPEAFPADLIVEGVDQTRGWFFTLHALAVLLFGQRAFKAVMATGLVLDKQGNKMSKRLGNSLDPFTLMARYGGDAVRWYMVANSPAWENLRLSPEGIEEIQRKCLGTLHHTYQFFALYAGLDGWTPQQAVAAPEHQGDQWILSRLHHLIGHVTKAYEAAHPTQAARLLQAFIIDDLSNWYVRLNRKRFWHGGASQDKHAAYTVLYRCLRTIAQLGAPIAPFYMERLYADLHPGAGYCSVHLARFPQAQARLCHPGLEAQVRYAQEVVSLVHALRKQHRIHVRQPLARLLIPLDEPAQKERLAAVASLIQAEVNIKEISSVEGTSTFLKKGVRPHLPSLGRKYGPLVPAITQAMQQITPGQLGELESKGMCQIRLEAGQELTLLREEVLIATHDIPGWATARREEITVALDLTRTPELIAEGWAREVVNRIQHLRKQEGLAVEDKIKLELSCAQEELVQAIKTHQAYVQGETQALELTWGKLGQGSHQVWIDGQPLYMDLSRMVLN